MITNLAAYSNTHLLFHSFCGQESEHICAVDPLLLCLFALLLKVLQAVIKVSLGLQPHLERGSVVAGSGSKLTQAIGRIHLLWLED